MPTPDFIFMLPVPKTLDDERERSMKELVADLATPFHREPGCWIRRRIAVAVRPSVKTKKIH